MKAKSVAIFTTSVLVIAACQRTAPKKEAGTRLLLEKAPVMVQVLQRQEMVRYFTYGGTLEPIRQVRILPEMPGKIAALKVDVGDSVQAGDTLAIMENTTLNLQLQQARAGLASAQAAYRDAETTLKRLKTLLKNQAVSQQQYDKARLGFDAAKAQLQQAQAAVALLEVQLQKTYLTAPFNGIITQKNLEEGDLINPAAARAPLYVLQDLSQIKVELYVPQQEIGAIRKGQRAILSLNGQLVSTEGRVTTVNQAADPLSKTFSVEVIFPNFHGKLTSGVFGEVGIMVKTIPATLVLPREAVLNERQVFVYRNGLARLVEIQPGLITERQIEIRSGLREGDTVIVKGNYLLTEGAPVKLVPDSLSTSVFAQ